MKELYFASTSLAYYYQNQNQSGLDNFIFQKQHVRSKIKFKEAGESQNTPRREFRKEPSRLGEIHLDTRDASSRGCCSRCQAACTICIICVFIVIVFLCIVILILYLYRDELELSIQTRTTFQALHYYFCIVNPLQTLQGMTSFLPNGLFLNQST